MQEFLVFNSDRELAAQCWAASPQAAVRRMFETGKVETERASSVWHVALYVDVDPGDEGVEDGLQLPADAPSTEVFWYTPLTIQVTTDYKGNPTNEKPITGAPPE